MLNVAPDLPPIALDAAGVARVGGTRVTLDSIVAAFDAGAAPEDLVTAYPSLDLATAYAVAAYILRHRNSVDAYLAQRRSADDAARASAEQRWPAADLRARLEARRRGT
ncbi:MAG: DUF433 domain-containing protein [Myxococcales bacterium]|nr:DUF433 domain-containing protein [Myxococcales bacterium]MCB9539378.1 DUF433 domain-containing protein [Myxococcales bacterium]